MTTKRKSKKGAKSARKSKSASKKRSAKAAPKSAGPSYTRAMSVARNASKSVKERVAALADSPLAVVEEDKHLQATLDILRNKEEPIEVRLAALQTIQAASFSVITFESSRPDYIAALRSVADDPDPELRQRVLGILAREKDGFAQKKLMEGLQNPEKALVPPEKALQLLSYDAHSEAYKVAREVVEKPPNTAAKHEALRLLAADATSAPIFEKVLRDKDETPELRRLSAAALQGLKPERLQSHAREILLDKSESDELQSTSLTALTQFGDEEAIGKDAELMRSIDRLSSEASPKVKQGARRFLGKYKP